MLLIRDFTAHYLSLVLGLFLLTAVEQWLDMLAPIAMNEGIRYAAILFGTMWGIMLYVCTFMLTSVAKLMAGDLQTARLETRFDGQPNALVLSGINCAVMLFGVIGLLGVYSFYTEDKLPEGALELHVRYLVIAVVAFGFLRITEWYKNNKVYYS